MEFENKLISAEHSARAWVRDSSERGLAKKRGEVMRVKHILLIAVSLCLGAAPLLQGQTALDDEIKIGSHPYIPQDPNAIRVKASLVEVTAVVRDARSRPISGLTKENFEILDQGKQQAISLFTAELAHPPATSSPFQTDIAAPAPTPVSAPRDTWAYISTIKPFRFPTWCTPEKPLKHLSEII